MRRGLVSLRPRSRIVVRDIGQNTQSNQLTITKPSVADGTLLILIAACNQANALSCSAFVDNKNGAGGFFYATKFIPSAAAETATSYTVTGGFLANFSGTIIALDGCNPTNPVAEVQRTLTATQTNIPCPVVTPTEDGQTFFTAFISPDAVTITGIPAGTSQIYNTTGAGRDRFGAMGVVPRGSTSGKAWTNAAANNGAVTFLLNPIRS